VLRVLYVDDDAVLRRLVERELGRRGWAVTGVASGDAALELLAREPVDVVALDYYMPGEDGLTVLSRIQQLESAPPVVFVTGTDGSRVAVAALTGGAANYVIKESGGDFLARLRRDMEDAAERGRLRREREQADAEVRAARDRFEQLARQREYLLREMNHRVSNSLQLIASMIHLQSATQPDERSRTALREAHDRVLAVAQVHRRLYDAADAAQVDMDQYLAGLASDIGRSAPQGTRVEVACDPIRLDTDKAVAVGIMATELLNAFKHAYRGAGGPVQVAFHGVDGGGCALSVADQDVGMPEDIASQPGGLGCKIIEAMVRRLSGRLALEPVSRGVKVRIELPA
jgi:two-component sensor histidine kinase